MSNEACIRVDYPLLFFMKTSEFKYLSKIQLRRRVKIYNVLIYLSPAIALASFIAFFLTDYKFNWSWLINGFTYALLAVNFVGQMRRMRTEITFREDRLKRRQEAALKGENRNLDQTQTNEN